MAPRFRDETDAQRWARLGIVENVLVCRHVRDLTRREFAELVPPRGPTGCRQNKTRGLILRKLRRAGFTCDGKQIT